MGSKFNPGLPFCTHTRLGTGAQSVRPSSPTRKLPVPRLPPSSPSSHSSILSRWLWCCPHSIELLSTQESRGRNFITPGISSHHTTCVPILLYCIHFLRRKGSIRTILLELIRPCEHLNCFLHVKSRRYGRNLP